MSGTDPTIEFLMALADPARYERTAGVPIITALKRTSTDADGTERTTVVSEEDLADIAANIAALEAEGVLVRLSLGHLNPELPDHDPRQPPIIGAYRNARVGTFGPHQKLAVLADQYVDRRHLAEVRTGYPYRSPEYFPATKTVRGVALLKRDPYLDMGMIALAADVGGMIAMADDNDKPANGNDMPPPSAKPSENGQDDEAAQAFARGWEAFARTHPVGKFLMKCYSDSQAGGPSVATPTNANIPQAVPVPPAPPPEPQRMQADSQALQLAQLQAEVLRLRSEADAQRRAAEAAVCERMVTQLEAQGFKLDRATEVGRMIPLTPAQRDKHAQYVREHYQRSATGAAFVPVADGMPVEGPPALSQATDEQVGAAVLLAGREKIGFADALKRVRAG